MTTTETARTRQIPTVLFPEFEARIADLAARAVKLGVVPMTFVEVGREMVESNEGGWHHSYEVVTVEISGETPVLPGGWEYLGAVEHLDGGNLIHGDGVVEEFRNAAADCDHCQVRRNRNKTVILRSESGRIVQVGSTCLKDFLGYHGNPDDLWKYQTETLEIWDECEGGFGGVYVNNDPTIALISVAAAAVRVHGWTPKSSYSGTPTYDIVKAILGHYGPIKSTDAIRPLIDEVEVTEADKALAAEVIDWAKALPEDSTDYLGNLRVVLGGDFVARKHDGLAVSAVSAYLRTVEREAVRKAQETAKAESVPMGQVGDRLTVTGTVTFVRGFDGDYGMSYLVSLVTEDGNIVKTFSSGAFGRGAEVGDTVTLKATVKAHDGGETMVTRAKVLG